MDQWHFGKDPGICSTDLSRFGFASGSCFFRQQLTRCQQKFFFFQSFLLITFWRYIYSRFQSQTSKRGQKSYKSRFFLLFCLLMEGSRSGSVQILTDLGGPKTIRILRAIRIHNTDYTTSPHFKYFSNWIFSRLKNSLRDYYGIISHKKLN